LEPPSSHSPPSARTRASPSCWTLGKSQRLLSACPGWPGTRSSSAAGSRPRGWGWTRGRWRTSRALDSWVVVAVGGGWGRLGWGFVGFGGWDWKLGRRLKLPAATSKLHLQPPWSPPDTKPRPSSPPRPPPAAPHRPHHPPPLLLQIRRPHRDHPRARRRPRRVPGAVRRRPGVGRGGAGLPAAAPRVGPLPRPAAQGGVRGELELGAPGALVRAL